jgi:hypothetical protein
MTQSCLYQHQLATATTLQHHQIMTRMETELSFHIQAKRRFLYIDNLIFSFLIHVVTRICDFPEFQSDAVEKNHSPGILCTITGFSLPSVSRLSLYHKPLKMRPTHGLEM